MLCTYMYLVQVGCCSIIPIYLSLCDLYYVPFLANLIVILIKYLLYGKQPWPRERLRLMLLHPPVRGP